MKTINLIEDTINPIDKPLQEFINELNKYLGQIPIEYRGSARIRLEGIGYDDDRDLYIEITYHKPFSKTS